MALTRVFDWALVTGAALRLTRLVTTDDIGEWVARGPAERWAVAREGSEVTYADGTPAVDEQRGWRSKMVSGLSCPHCVGYWLGAATVTSYLAARRRPRSLAAWRFVAGTLSLSTVTGHVSARID